MKPPEALRLADALYAAPETGAMPDDIQGAADELVRLHKATQAMLEALKHAVRVAEMRDGKEDEWVELASAAIAKGEQQ